MMHTEREQFPYWLAIMRHTQSEKRSSAPPSGMPGVETMVPLMLQEVVEKRLDLSRLVNSMAEAPADRLGLSRGRIEKGQPADFMLSLIHI